MPRPVTSFARFIIQLALQDWLVLAYFVGLNLAWLLSPGPGPRLASAIQMGGLLLAFSLVVLLVRWGILRDGFFSPLLYRVAILGTVQSSYFFFGSFLPLVNPGSLDEALHRFDLDWFGGEPAVTMQRGIFPATTEWFAFFYFCYFILLAVHTIPILLGSRRPRLLGEFALGMLLLFCTGHTLYMLVPGFGPYRAIASQLTTPLPHGIWLDTVMATVHGAGAQKDIFPSLHTAAPTFIALFSFRHRSFAPYRSTWPLLAFFAINIVVATMFLRWHWLVDVIAGLCLATAAFVLSIAGTDYELRRRQRHGLSASWPAWGTAEKSNPS